MSRINAILFGFLGVLPIAFQPQQNAETALKVAIGLPKPTGTHSIGRKRFEWADESRRAQAGGPRPLVVWIYYPSEALENSYAEYLLGVQKLPDDTRTAVVKDSFGPAWILVRNGKVKISATDDAPISGTSEKWPVILFSPGLGMVSAAYSAQLEELASHGYAVVAIDHPYDSALMIRSDGTLIPFDRETWTLHQPPGPPSLAGMKFGNERQEDWVEDSRFVLRQLRAQADEPFFKALDLQHVGAMGHSFGGTVAVRLCQTEVIVLACLNEDGEMTGRTLTPGEAAPPIDPNVPPKRPLMVLSVLEPTMKDNPFYIRLYKARQDGLRAFLQTGTSPAYWIAIESPDVSHGSFSDISLLYANPNRENSLKLNEFTRKASGAFFDHFLKGTESARLERVLSEAKVGSVSKFHLGAIVGVPIKWRRPRSSANSGKIVPINFRRFRVASAPVSPD
jgi:hypothetical protein